MASQDYKTKQKNGKATINYYVLSAEKYKLLDKQLNDVISTPIVFPDVFEGSMSDVPIIVIRRYTDRKWAIRDAKLNSRKSFYEFGLLLEKIKD